MSQMTRRQQIQKLEQNTPMVRKIVGGFQRKLPRNVLREDLMQAGLTGLWDAVQRFVGPDEQFPFYARCRIRGAILDELRAQDWMPRRMRAQAAKNQSTLNVVRIDDVSEHDQGRHLAVSPLAEQLLTDQETRERVVMAMLQIPDRERQIIEDHYFDGIKLKDLAQRLGVSEPRVSQLHSRAVERLEQLLA